jgi:hypothetical protein
MYRQVTSIFLVLLFAGVANSGLIGYRIDGKVYTIEESKVAELIKSNGTELTIRTLTVDPEDPVVDPPVSGTLTAWVANRLKSVPDHKYKKEISQGLAAGYIELAKAHTRGDIPLVSEVLAKRKELHKRVTSLLGAEKEWKSFDEDLLKELTRRQVPTAQLSATLEQIASGLTGNEAINPILLGIMAKVILALISGNEINWLEIIQAILGLK